MSRHVRTEVHQLRVLARTGADPVTAPFTDRSDDRVSAEASRRRLAGALATLPGGHRDALFLVAWAGFTYPEVAHPPLPGAGAAPAWCSPACSPPPRSPLRPSWARC
ncbi:hypothetical protein [Nonomuraea sp. NPDC005650]|uniref:RNA polymerase sigma factor n=1 Tax=Nonomuraea sp. NPDC005650 TaxID=3157045 RepID=UPI0033B05346